VKSLKLEINWGIVVLLLTAVLVLVSVAFSMNKKKAAAGGNTYRDLIAKILIVIEGVPLIAYPFVLMANIMQVAAYQNGEGKFLSHILIILFVFLTTVYPVSYVVCIWFVFRRAGKHKLWISLIPAAHILPVLLIFAFG
jgi:hypothetical protein